MRLLPLILIALSPVSWALEDFPEKELREGFARLFLMKIASELSSSAGRGPNFDAAKAQGLCLGIEDKLSDQLQKKRELFDRSRAARARQQENWDSELRAELDFGGATKPGVPLAQSIKEHLALQWPCTYPTFMPCVGESTEELVNNLALDDNLIDQTIASTCLRLVRAIKRGGSCSTIPTPPPSCEAGSQSISTKQP